MSFTVRASSVFGITVFCVMNYVLHPANEISEFSSLTGITEFPQVSKKQFTPRKYQFTDKSYVNFQSASDQLSEFAEKSNDKGDLKFIERAHIVSAVNRLSDQYNMILPLWINNCADYSAWNYKGHCLDIGALCNNMCDVLSNLSEIGVDNGAANDHYIENVTLRMLMMSAQSSRDPNTPINEDPNSSDNTNSNFEDSAQCYPIYEENSPDNDNELHLMSKICDDESNMKRYLPVVACLIGSNGYAMVGSDLHINDKKDAVITKPEIINPTILQDASYESTGSVSDRKSDASADSVSPIKHIADNNDGPINQIDGCCYKNELGVDIYSSCISTLLYRDIYNKVETFSNESKIHEFYNNNKVKTVSNELKIGEFIVEHNCSNVRLTNQLKDGRSFAINFESDHILFHVCAPTAYSIIFSQADGEYAKCIRRGFEKCDCNDKIKTAITEVNALVKQIFAHDSENARKRISTDSIERCDFKEEVRLRSDSGSSVDHNANINLAPR